MNKISIQNLRSIFDFIENNTSLVLWIRSLDYRRQLYVSPSYKKIWGQRTDLLYEHPESWNDFLYTDDIQQMLSITQERIENKSSCTQEKLLFRIKNTNNQILYIKDAPYQLTDENNHTIAFAGISEVVSEAQWLEEQKKISLLENTPQDQLKNYLFNVLRDELKLQCNPTTINKRASILANDAKFQYLLKDSNLPLDLSEREAECLLHLISGKSAKITATLMNISTRTVEFHINNIKKKAGCRTKIEILGKIVNAST